MHEPLIHLMFFCELMLTKPSVATVQKIVTEILHQDPGVTFAKETRDLLIECCVEFITLISSEANEIADKDAKKTIACEHVTAALEQLGYPDYIPEIMKVAQEHKAQQAVSTAFLRGDIYVLMDVA